MFSRRSLFAALGLALPILAAGAANAATTKRPADPTATKRSADAATAKRTAPTGRAIASKTPRTRRVGTAPVAKG